MTRIYVHKQFNYADFFRLKDQKFINDLSKNTNFIL